MKSSLPLKVTILTLSSFTITLVLFLSHGLSIFELKAYDLFSRYLNPQGPSEDIFLVQVDQPSLDALSREGITWPWPRQMYAPIIEYLSEADAVFIDILYTEPSSYGQEDDLIFAEAVKKASNVYLPVFLSGREKPWAAEEEEFIRSIAIPEGIPAVSGFYSAVTPIDVLKTSLRGSGNVVIPPDEDGVYRKVPLAFQLQRKRADEPSEPYTIPHFVLGYLLRKGAVKLVQNALYVDDAPIPLKEGKLLLRYYRDPHPFPAFSAIDLLNSYNASQTSIPPPIKKDLFKGKVVFIGLTAAGLFDLKATATSSISTGVLVHATTLENMVHRSFIKPVGGAFVIAFMLAICLFISYSILKRHSLYINLSLFLISLVLVLLIPAFLFKEARYMEIIPPVTSLIVSFILSVAYSYATEGKERLFLKRTFSQYMDKKVADYLLQNPSLIKPGGQRRRVTVFFADIAGFTSISEITSAEEVATMLHTVLDALTEVIIRNHGVIDKYIGDCIMAFWGAPVETDQDEINAGRAAIQCMEVLGEINKSFRGRGRPEIGIRVGIHSGDAIAGNIGSDRLFHYTVIGDTVNLASRLESANKFFKTKIMVSEDTFRRTDNTFFARELGTIAVKGKTMPIKIFELLGEEENIPPDKRRKVMDFHRGMAFFKDQKWPEAIKIFDQILQENPQDGPSEYYKKRCEDLLSNFPLTEDWIVIRMTEK